TPYFVLALAFGLMTIWFQGHGAITGGTVQTESFWGRLAGAGWAVWFYLEKALLPLNLNLIYPRWQMDAASPLSYVPMLLLCAASLSAGDFGIAGDGLCSSGWFALPSIFFPCWVSSTCISWRSRGSRTISSTCP